MPGPLLDGWNDEVEVKLAGFEPARGLITISANDTERLPIALQPSVGALDVSTIPPGATLTIDGEPIPGPTPVRLEGRAVGNHQLRHGTSRKTLSRLPRFSRHFTCSRRVPTGEESGSSSEWE